jgi:NAD(P)-dependent dehydrogenase (short-subunit alcohol dehydrogenase family)
MSAAKKTALVTGGARGIGFGVSMALAKSGFNLALCGTKDASDVAEPLERLKSAGAEVLYVRCDVSNAGQRENLLQKIKERFGALNTLVNNAGVAPLERKDILDAGEDSFDRLININLKGPYFLTQAAAKMMIEAKKACPALSCSIIFITSVSADAASVNRGDYCLSKAGLSMAVKLWAARLGEHDIPVYEIRPGIIQTDMTSGVKEKYDKLIAEGIVPQRRWGFPDDIGAAAAALARGDIPYATGSVIMLDGGLSVPRL